MHSPAFFPSRWWLTRFAGATALSLLAACDVPTSIPKAPILDVRWVVPSQTTRITVANLIPANVKIVPDSSGFEITLTPASTTVSRTLAQDCAECAAANGLSVPKPAFIATASTTTSLPSEFASATLVAGSLRLVVNNGFTFDPLRPSASAAAPRGFALITVSNGSTVIGKDSVSGNITALPSGGSITRDIPLAGALVGSSPVTVTVTVNSPAGDVVLMDANRTISATATPSGLKVASANVTVANRSVSSTTTIDLSSVDSAIQNRVKSGALLLTVANPFNVTGTLTVRLTPAGGSAITRTVQLAAGASTPPPIAFNEAEIRSLLGKVVTVTYTGTVNSTGGSVSVSPRQAVVVTTRLDLNLRVGG